MSVAQSGREALQLFFSDSPSLVILDAALGGPSGYEVVERIKASPTKVPAILLLGKRIGVADMRRVAECGCDEVLIAPMSGDELYDVVAGQLDLPRRGSERSAIDLPVVGQEGERRVDGRVTNLSTHGARLLFPEPLGEGSELWLTISGDDSEHEPLRVRAKIVWAQTRDDSTLAGAAFLNVDEALRARLSRLTQWEVVDDGDEERIVIRGELTESTRFADLLPAIGEHADFDLSGVSYMDSLGVREWSRFLLDLPAASYAFHSCSTAFVLQASFDQGVLGKGEVASFFAPYVCDHCGYEEDRWLQTAEIRAADNSEPPRYSCPSCRAEALRLNDLPDRYFAFLADD